MKKFILLMSISTLLFTSACTRIPLSEETGAGPGEYEGVVGTEEIKKKNSVLKEELEKTNKALDEAELKLEDLQEEYLSLAKSNENIIFKLEEAESKLNIVNSEDMPDFNTESTDVNSILLYLNDSSKVIDGSIKGIEIISGDSDVVFRTLGYGDDYSQIFIWSEGENQPLLIDGGSFTKEGSYEWLGAYILIDDKGKSKILDVENKVISDTFDQPEKREFLSGNLILLKDKDNNFSLYNLEDNTNKEINLDNNKYRDFYIGDNDVVFTGNYSENDVEYEIRALIGLEKLTGHIPGIEGSEADDTEAEEVGEDTV